MFKDLSSLVEENEKFCKEIEQKKYYQEGEKDWFDLVKRFYVLEDGFLTWLLENKYFLFGGSILANFNTKNKNCSLSNCYFIPVENDSIEAIGNTLTKNMRTFSWRGGVGNSLEVLRPKNEITNNASDRSTGSVSFMPLFSVATQTIGQEGRRGASILTHAIWHPDILDFINSKAFPEKVFAKDNLKDGYIPDISAANISVKLTDAFMSAEAEDKEWEFVFPDIQANKDFYNREWDGDLQKWIEKGGKIKSYGKIKARELLGNIAQACWEYAEPGVLFWDTAIKHTPMSVFPELRPMGVNPCGEEILAKYDACHLAAHVLYKYVENPWQPNAKFDFSLFRQAIRASVRAMDKLIDKNTHPLKEQEAVAKLGRKLGIGITGLADCLAMLGIKYDSEEAVVMAGKILCFKAFGELVETIELSKEKGACPVFRNAAPQTKEQYAEHPFFKRVILDYCNFFDNSADPQHVYELFVADIKKYGVRNVATSTIAPTGTLSIIAGNCTSGIEPLFALSYKRRSRLADKDVEIIHPPLLKYLVQNGYVDCDLPEKEILEKFNYVQAHDVGYRQRILMQSICQRYTTDSISSTINLPENTTVEEIKEILLTAWKANLKGLTIYRNNCRLKGILLKEDKKENVVSVEKGKKELPTKIELSDEEMCIRYRVKWKNGSDVYLQITIDKQGCPLEVFARVPKQAGETKYGYNKTIVDEYQSLWDAVCRQVSIGLRYRIPLQEIVHQLERSANSMFDISAIIAKKLKQCAEKYKVNNGLLINDEQVDKQNGVCVHCGGNNVVRENGCLVCMDCGFSKCD